jgi:hypothetical protein
MAMPKGLKLWVVHWVGNPVTTVNVEAESWFLARQQGGIRLRRDVFECECRFVRLVAEQGTVLSLPEAA